MYVYGDDGADARKERVTAVSVIAGYEDWWQDLEQKWLARCGGVPFHAKDCESDWGDFAPQSPELADAKHRENKNLYRDLTTILAESKVGGTGRFETISYSKQWFEDLKRNLGNLENKVGFNQQDYRQWLTDRGRHHDLSNMFQFLDWIRRRDEKRI